VNKILFAVVILLSMGACLWAQSISVQADFSIVIDDTNNDRNIERIPLTVYGYGYGNSRSVMMSRSRAEANAREALAMQISGNQISYTREDGNTSFTLGVEALVQGARTESLTVVDETKVFVIAAADTEVEMPVDEDIITTGLIFNSEDDGSPIDSQVENLLGKMMYDALLQVLEEIEFSGNTLNGIIYVSNLQVSF